MTICGTENNAQSEH